MGFGKIKIYNGGLKDWKKSGYKIEAIEPLPDHKGKLITADELLERIKQADSCNCLDQNNNSLLTIIDIRTENFLKLDRPILSIKTKCKIVQILFDDFQDPELRSRIPRKGMVVLVCETGNRDQLAMKYLYQHGYANMMSLQYGMRGWIKTGYPTCPAKK